ncbi:MULTISPECIES: glutathione S-transferase family protein [Falsihalocynthiibacter]|uniref:glutathione S-transferase family protein n=1 Tax=Falsihalocynthiibacter TaxID=2854182 RepID=UPI00300103F0
MTYDSTQQILSQLTTRFPGVPVGPEATPRYHFFHAPNSICSQKVRAVLAYHQVSHSSHLLDIFAGETYDPAYVRVRMQGCARLGVPLAAQHLGTTSVEASGCDGCVVPTLVDAQDGTVFVDSLRICQMLDASEGGGALVPAALRAAIMAELAVVDDLPNYQNLAVRVVPASAPGNAFAASKVARCDTLLAEHGDDPVLRAAYEAKRAKEQFAADMLFDEVALTRARQAVVDALDGLEDRLADSNGPWLFGATITMADLFWGAELIRTEDVGQGQLWQLNRLPYVAAYYARLCALPALCSAIVDFPGARLAPPKSAVSA